MSITRRTMLRIGAASAAAALLSPNALARPHELTIGFLYQDSASFDRDSQLLDESLGDRIRTRFIGDLSPGEDGEAALRSLIADGAGMIVATHPAFADMIMRIAPEYPGVLFEQAGHRQAQNVGAYAARLYEGLAVLGEVAGHVSRTGRIVYVAQRPSPAVMAGINAFTLAARQVNPDTLVRPAYLSASKAQAYLTGEEDLVVDHRHASAQLRDHQDILALVSTHWGSHYLAAAQAVLAGTWTTRQTWQGMADGSVQVHLAEPLAATIPLVSGLDGRRAHQIFRGPVHDATGTSRIADGAVAGHGDLERMDWYVHGIGQPA